MAELYTRYRDKAAKKAGRISGYSAVFYDPARRPKQKYVTLRTKDKRIARRRLIELEKRESLGRFDPWQDQAPEYGVTLDETVRRFYAARTTVREKTRDEENRTLIRFQRTLPTTIKLDAVEGYHIESYINAKKPDGSDRAPATRRRYHAVLSGFFDWCVEEGLIEHHPMTKLVAAKVHRREARFLTPTELELLLAQIDGAATAREAPEAGGVEGEVSWLADAVRVQAGTGLRIGELSALRWSAVDLNRRQIIVGRHEKTKSGHERVVPVAGEALVVLQRLAVGKPKEGFVITGAGGGRLSNGYASKRIKHYAEAAGLGGDVTSHSIRHTYGARLASEGISLYMIQRLMGHESFETTTRFYGHLYQDKLQEAVEGVFGQ